MNQSIGFQQELRSFNQNNIDTYKFSQTDEIIEDLTYSDDDHNTLIAPCQYTNTTDKFNTGQTKVATLTDNHNKSFINLFNERFGKGTQQEFELPKSGQINEDF